MKKLAIIIVISLLAVISASAQGLVSSGQSTVSKENQPEAVYSTPASGFLADRPAGTVAANLGVGFGSWGFSLAVDGEYTFVNFASGMSLAGGVYGTVGFSEGTHIFVGPEAAFHWAVLDQLDLFTKLILGYHHYSYTYMGYTANAGSFHAGAYVGATYYLSKTIGIGGVVGFGGPNVAAQITFRF